jgi:hypothetical protein
VTTGTDRSVEHRGDPACVQCSVNMYSLIIMDGQRKVARACVGGLGRQKREDRPPDKGGTGHGSYLGTPSWAGVPPRTAQGAYQGPCLLSGPACPWVLPLRLRNQAAAGPQTTRGL